MKFACVLIAAGATLIASPEQGDFDNYEELPFKPVDDHETTYFRYALLAGEGLHDVSIRGPGAIDGNRGKRGGPKPIALKRSERVSVREVTIRNSPNYAISLLGCDDVDIDGVRILNSYCDGIDPDCSRFVRISNCYVDSWDYAIVLKTSQALGEPRRFQEHRRGELRDAEARDGTRAHPSSCGWATAGAA
ncbi:MAG: glycosyl hydrolase family 28 protein [Acidobacteriota bacterium]